MSFGSVVGVGVLGAVLRVTRLGHPMCAPPEAMLQTSEGL